MKPRVAFFDFASCEGCQLQIANLEEDVIELAGLVDVVSFREVMKEHSDDYDIAFIEGSIQRPIDEERLREIRKNAKLVIPIGACACTGGVNKLRTEDKLEMAKEEVYGIADPEVLRDNPFFDTFHTKAIDEVIDVDFYIRGCPIRKEQILYYVNRLHSIPPHKNLDVRFPIITPDSPVDTRSLVQYDRNKCIICRRCDTICCSVLGVDALGVVEKGPEVIISTPNNIGFDDNGCIHCGQCISVCSVGALEAHADVTSLVSELRAKATGMVAVIDSIALASYVLENPNLRDLDPKEAERTVTSALRLAGFDRVIQYEPYVQQSLDADVAACEPSAHRMTSWCKSAFNFATDRIPVGKVSFDEELSPWSHMIRDCTEDSSTITLLSPCTALKGVEGISHVLSALEFDELFRRMSIEVGGVLPADVPYDGTTVDRSVRNPEISTIQELGDHPVTTIPVSHELHSEISSLGLEGTLVDIHPCIMRCVNGGGNHPSVDAGIMKERKNWLNRLWGDA
jgi:coenzyme F420-reducing hydrogenase gamma subunit